MDFPNEILHIIGHYAVSSLVDAQILDRAGIIKAHGTSLSHVQLEFQDVDQAIRAIDPTLFASVRMIKVMQTSSVAGLQRLANLAPNLEELDLGKCRGLTHTDQVGLFRKLRSLTMDSCKHFYGVSSTTLRKLTLIECEIDFGLSPMNFGPLIFFNCPTLMTTHGFPVCPAVTCLKLDFCKLITDDKLRMLMISFPYLKTFSAAFTGITDLGVAHIPCSVQDLELRGCHITDDALPFLMHLRSLLSLDISHTKIQRVTMLPNSLQMLNVSG